jgi:hypothetical protein
MEKMEQNLSKHGEQIHKIFKYLKQYEQIKKQGLDQQNRKKVGFRRKMNNDHFSVWRKGDGMIE